jgi:hypothetical protein
MKKLKLGYYAEEWKTKTTNEKQAKHLAKQK